jgi:hypothetical protein
LIFDFSHKFLFYNSLNPNFFFGSSQNFRIISNSDPQYCILWRLKITLQTFPIKIYNDSVYSRFRIALDEKNMMIRGSVYGFSQFLPTGPAFSQCTACSNRVIQLFKVKLRKFLFHHFDHFPWLPAMECLMRLEEDYRYQVPVKNLISWKYL